MSGVNKTASDFTAEEWEALTPAQREQLEKADRGELPVDYRSPLYDEPASENFVHALDPDAEDKGGATDTTAEPAPVVDEFAAREDAQPDQPPAGFEGNAPSDLTLDGEDADPDD
jgi:hypothetical protein